jgi:hypothetical protein
MSYSFSDLSLLVSFSSNDVACCYTHMLVYEDDANVFPLSGKLVKGSLDRGRVCLGVHDEEVLLGIGRRRNVLS